MNSLLYTALSALDTFSDGWQVIANNVANVNTPGYRAGQARYQDAPHGRGVQLAEISTDTSPGSPTPGSPMPGVPMEGRGEYVNRLTLERAEASAEAAAARSVVDERAAELREASNVRLEREIAQAVSTERAFEANAVTVATYDDMMGTVLDLIV